MVTCARKVVLYENSAFRESRGLVKTWCGIISLDI